MEALSTMPVPRKMAHLYRDRRGFPVPWFVQWMDADGKPCRDGEGVPDFRVFGADKFRSALHQRRCWVCGEALGKFLAFVIGPMCAITRTTSEPACHRECAEFSATACPFLSRPRMRRNDVDLPANAHVAGVFIRRNPGVACVWITRTFQVFRTEGGDGAGAGSLITIGAPSEVLWFAEGRAATRAEVMASIESGYPALQAQADKDVTRGYVAAHRELAGMRNRIMGLLPKETVQA